MNESIITAIAGAGGSVSVIALMYVVYWLITKHKQNKQSNNINKSANNINITHTKQGDEVNALIHLIEQQTKKIDDIDKKLSNIKTSQDRYNAAFKVYVENNGVSNDVKKIVKQIINGEN
ncbi:hypothetical protein U5U50_01695 [Mycoplasma sp. 888]|uniref:hypothetical protein n=1 Tax=Mycoplasma sp. 888 TaxID=3108483 RepID=UPI002D77BF0F|nr:hypothetical protein [Mycoplasma sp. 888]WRQ26095.1 hypothetical protein U5U50_01695 [Mycoplasma sp. 888]